MFLLEAANIDRARDPELGKLLDSLLDPAVRVLRLDVITLDGLFCSIEDLGQSTRLLPQSERILIRTLGEMLQQISDLEGLLKAGKIKQILTGLNEQWQHTIDVTPLNPASVEKLAFAGGHNPVGLQVPAGINVQLTARPLVSGTLFEGDPPVLDVRLKQLAVSTDGDVSVFDGATLIIENMIGQLLWTAQGAAPWEWLLDRKHWTEVAQRVIQYEPADTARVYDLRAKEFDKKDWQWRQLGAVTVTTQRWRFLGRPIYAWINPKAGETIETGRASRLIKNETEQLHAFEEDAFNGRDPRDAKSITVNLQPSPAATTLHQVQWEKPSASFFRHRFTLHSRYTAALESNISGQCDAWPVDTERTPQYWLRVAMLAEPSRVVLTRPQMRALIR